MKLRYLPVNAWAFLLGDDIKTATVQDIGGFGRFFSSRHEAVYAAEQCGLTVDKFGRVEARK